MKTSHLENVLGKNQLTKQYSSKFFECRSQVSVSVCNIQRALANGEK